MVAARQTALLSAGTTPALVLDFAATGVLDSRIAFSRASAATYVNSAGVIATATSGVPRFGYDPRTLAPLGLLVEEARTNIQTQSGNAADASWAPANASVSGGQADPFGGTGAVLVTANGVSGPHALTGPVTAAVADATQYAMSIFVKAGSGNIVQFGVNLTSFANTVFANYTLTGSGVVNLVGAGVTSAAIEAYPNGWYRLAMVATTSTGAGTTTGKIFFISTAADGRNPTTTVSYSLYVTGIQMEATTAGSPHPTSYIPTTTAAVTRLADVVSMTGGNFSSWYNQAAGTFLAQITMPGDFAQFAAVLSANTSSFLNTHHLFKSDVTNVTLGKRWVAATTVSGTVQAQSATSVDGGSGTSRLAYAYAPNDFGFVVDGALVGTDNSGLPPAPTNFWIGQRDGTGYWLNGHIGSVRYYNTRLANAQMQVLTA